MNFVFYIIHVINSIIISLYGYIISIDITNCIMCIKLLYAYNHIEIFDLKIIGSDS